MEREKEYYVPIKIYDFTISGNRYDVSFYMGEKTKKLQSIGIWYKEKRGGAVGIASTLESSLIKKYGKPSYRNVDNDMIRIEWFFPSTTITLGYAKNIFNFIYYSKSDTETTDKL